MEDKLLVKVRQLSLIKMLISTEGRACLIYVVSRHFFSGDACLAAVLLTPRKSSVRLHLQCIWWLKGQEDTKPAQSFGVVVNVTS